MSEKGKNGNENIVVLVNGRRLNNIDGIPQLLSAISLDSVEKIEILKDNSVFRCSVSLRL